MGIEIERKFLLTAYPAALIQAGEIVIQKEQFIEQTYLALDGDQEIRARKITDLATNEVEYTHTFKKGFGLAREEVEYTISAGLYEQIIHAHGTIALTKKRTTAEWNNTIIEIDEYDQIKLAVLEVEFPSLQEAKAFEAPAWFGQDISTSKEYSNKKVWRDLQEQAK
ncbi:CYTH domain-containing protein [Neobacillus mesonae]|nr:CYTH domain-containing protein [Neobacillus mesonae]